MDDKTKTELERLRLLLGDHFDSIAGTSMRDLFRYYNDLGRYEKRDLPRAQPDNNREEP